MCLHFFVGFVKHNILLFFVSHLQDLHGQTTVNGYLYVYYIKSLYIIERYHCRQRAPIENVSSTSEIL